jgi:hypothetical protein
MLISMPTGTSTIFGVFQVIRLSQVMVQHSHRCERKTATRSTQGSARYAQQISFTSTNEATLALPGFVVPSRRAFRRHLDWLY